VFLGFLRRLIRHTGRKVFLIVDEHPVHLAEAVERWVGRHHRQIRLFFLPGYAPELNPDEYLNQENKVVPETSRISNRPSRPADFASELFFCRTLTPRRAAPRCPTGCQRAANAAKPGWGYPASVQGPRPR
jgi:hypothetical protein